VTLRSGKASKNVVTNGLASSEPDVLIRLVPDEVRRVHLVDEVRVVLVDNLPKTPR
jgi:hypothetical protein